MSTKHSRTTLQPVAERPLLVDYAAERFESLCRAANYGDATASNVAAFRDLLRGWGEVPVGPRRDWQSEISDDNTPVEFSVAFGRDGNAEVRALLEPQATEPSVDAFRREALGFFERVGRDYGAELGRFRKLQDVLLFEGMQGPFSVWASAVFRRLHAPEFKAYFNPQARGAQAAPGLTERALERLGLGAAWPGFEKHALRRGTRLDELKYVALDLTASASARVKVYVRHHACTAHDLEAVSGHAESYVPGEVSAFVRAMQGTAERLVARAAFTCSAFVGSGERPAAVTTYVPVCAYSHDDASARQRVRDFMNEAGLDGRVYESIMNRYPNRRLDVGTGLQSWCAFRRYRGDARVTVYLAIEANQVFEPGTVPAPTTDHSELVRRSKAG